jgi:hypothetical protein
VRACLRNASLPASYTNSDMEAFVVGLEEQDAILRVQELVMELEEASKRQGIKEYNLLSTRNTITLCHPVTIVLG